MSERAHDDSLRSSSAVADAGTESRGSRGDSPGSGGSLRPPQSRQRPAHRVSAGTARSGLVADAQLPNMEARYRALVEQIPAVVFMAYLDQGIGEAYVSPQIEAALGFSQEEWLEDPVRWYSHIHPDDKQRWSTEAAEMFLTGNPLRSAYRVVARDGRVIWFHCEAKMIRKEDGEPWFIHGVGFDITDLKRTEEALQEERNVVSAILQAIWRWPMYGSASACAAVGALFRISHAAQRVYGPLLQMSRLINQYDEARIAVAVVAKSRQPAARGRSIRQWRAARLEGHVTSGVTFKSEGASARPSKHIGKNAAAAASWDEAARARPL